MQDSIELKGIIEKFAASGWDIIDQLSKVWLENPDAAATADLISAVKQADQECGSCGCEFDTLYKRALELLSKSKNYKGDSYAKTCRVCPEL